MLQMQETTQHAGQMVMQDEVARMLRSNVSDKVKHKTGCELMELIFFYLYLERYDLGRRVYSRSTSEKGLQVW